METVEKAMLILFAAFVGESVNEFLFMPFFDLLKDKISEVLRGQLARLWSCGVGIALAFLFRLGVFSLFGVEATIPEADYVLTGALLGRGSNWIHEMLNRFVLSNDERKASIAWFEESKKLEK